MLKEVQQSFKYSGHNSSNRTFSARGIGDIEYTVSFPESVDSDRGVSEWSKPACESLTRSYWRDQSLDKIFNIKRKRTIGIEGLWFHYNYRDGIVEIYDIVVYRTSIWSALKMFDPKPETCDSIKSEIEKGGLRVSEVKFIEGGRYEKTRFKYEDLV
jgi:hypothetical protein